ncbi:MAG: hypothetical protein JNN07_12035 [Verrucomicrobiales bacterium]|nr:hypothetical protein [Verrucomicrobiales bacterium]
MNFARSVLLAIVGLLASSQAQGFTFIGPFKPWMVEAIGYQVNSQDGGPLPPDEGFRWNTPTIYYAFDRSFIEYFGTNGVAAVESALKVYSDLPAFGSMSTDLSEYPLNTRGLNFSARQTGLIDLKSQTMGLMMQQLGVGAAEHFVWSIKSRVVRNQVTNYTVVKYNYDPVTLRPSSYVNGALYTYEIYDPLTLPDNTTAALAGEIKVSDLRTRGYSSVANSTADGGDTVVSVEQDPVTGTMVSASGELLSGQYFFGLTRDDVGGLRRLYSSQNLAVENLYPGAIVSGGASVVGGNPWEVTTLTNTIIGTNVLGTNTSIALRPGLGKLKFSRVNYDSIVGQAFNPFVVNYNETIILNFRQVSRRVSRLVTQPDILFSARDIGTSPTGLPFAFSVTQPSSWTANAALNTHSGVGGGGGDGTGPIGPGVISGTVEVAFTSLYPAFVNINPGDIAETAPVAAWGSYDGSPTPPVVYPFYGGTSFQTLQQIAASGGLDTGSGLSPWASSVIVVVGTNTTTAGTTP